MSEDNLLPQSLITPSTILTSHKFKSSWTNKHSTTTCFTNN